MMWLCYIIMIVVPYLLGGVNTSIIVTKLKTGKDIRTMGSGNAGLTNTLRTQGKAVASCKHTASMNETKFGLYEPSGGSAPDIAGQNKANPIATILSAAMMLRYSFDMNDEADAVENAVRQTIRDGYRTGDIMSDGMKLLSCTEMGSKIAEYI